MSDYVLSCCSPADLSREVFESCKIEYVPFHFAVDGEEYLDDLGTSMSHKEFYDRLRKGAETRTAQVNIAEYVEFFTRFAQNGQDIVHVCLSSGLSGTVNSARNAALIVGERFPQRHIYVIDSLAASSGYGLLMVTAAEKRDRGLSAQELADWLENNKRRLNHLFFSTDLSAYVRGGRISKNAAVFGGVLQICPLLDVDASGRLAPREKIRTKKKVITEIVKRMEQFADDGSDYSGRCFICNSDCREDAEAVAALIEERFPKLNGRISIFSIGTTIGSHTGIGSIGIFFFGRERA